MLKVARSAVIATVLSSCASPQPALIGPDRPLSDVASIRGSNLCSPSGSVVGETRISAVNDKSASSFELGYQRDLLVQPGALQLSVRWFYANLLSDPATLSLVAEPGHRYIVRARTDYEQRVSFSIDDKGPGSGSTPFVHPMTADGKPSNCY